jgi:hypothetical protein
MTQVEKVAKYIDEYGSITALDAMRDLGVMRLASRIADLKNRGYAVVSEIVAVKNRYGERTYIARYRWEEQA